MGVREVILNADIATLDNQSRVVNAEIDISSWPRREAAINHSTAHIQKGRVTHF